MAIFTLLVVKHFSIFQKMTFAKFGGIFATIITPSLGDPLSVFWYAN